MGRKRDLDDWRVAPNITTDPETYELENEALRRDGRLDEALFALGSWHGKVLVDIGCGTGFWLPQYADRAQRVIGVEPDPSLLVLAERRTAHLPDIEVVHGSAEHLPLGDNVADLVHARFAYFFGAGAEAGLEEALRVLVPGGKLFVIDNSWSGGEFADLLRAATHGNAAIDPAATDEWWAERKATRHEVEGGWSARSRDELERILRIEFPSELVTRFMENHHRSSLSYRFAVYELESPE